MNHGFGYLIIVRKRLYKRTSLTSCMRVPSYLNKRSAIKRLVIM